MLCALDLVFSNKISKIYFCFLHWQSHFNELQNILGEKIMFIKGFSGVAFFEDQGLEGRTEHSDPVLIVLDDCKCVV